MLKPLTLLLVLTACSTGKNDARPNKEAIDGIIEIKELYLSLIPEVQDDYGFVYSDQCDSLLWTGLSVFAGAKADMLSARDERTGQWFRTPYHDCYQNFRDGNVSSRKSKSTISGDGFAGLFWSIDNIRDLVVLEDLIDYGRDHKWIMGEGPLSRTFMSPNQQKTLYVLAGKSFKGLPDVWIDPVKDYQRHVVALNIVRRGEEQGHIADEALDLIEGFAKDQPCNGFFQYGLARFKTGDFDPVYKLIDKYCPKDRLPNSSDHSGRWLWERGCSHEAYKPSDEGKTHSGGDCTFLIKLLEMAHEG